MEDKEIKYDRIEGSPKCPECGNTQFFAKQKCYHDIVVSGNNTFIDNVAVSDADTPYGPYQCTECDKEFDELTELKK